MNDKIRYILERLPGKSHLIALHVAKDAEFAALCEDYNDCENALRYWSRSKAPEAEIRVKEYRSLVEELEEEISLFLSTKPPGRLD